MAGPHLDHAPVLGVANGIATLGVGGKVPTGQLPQATEIAIGVAEIATQAEVNTGTDDLRFVTPLKLAALLASGAGVVASVTSSATTDTTASGTPSLLQGMTVTPGAGTYLVFFLGEGSVDKNSRFAFTRIRFNGVANLASERRVGGQASNLGSWPSAAIGTVAAGQTIQVYWGMQNPGAGAVASSTARSLVLIKLG